MREGLGEDVRRDIVKFDTLTQGLVRAFSELLAGGHHWASENDEQSAMHVSEPMLASPNEDVSGVIPYSHPSPGRHHLSPPSFLLPCGEGTTHRSLDGHHLFPPVSCCPEEEELGDRAFAFCGTGRGRSVVCWAIDGAVRKGRRTVH